jgi:hypothetical protein
MSRLTAHIETAASLTTGVLAVLWLQAAYGWWLNSSAGVLRTSTVLFALAFLIAVARSGRAWRRAIALWLGVMATMTTTLLIIGPGNLWPIVLVVAAGLSAAVVFGGSWIGAHVRAP